MRIKQRSRNKDGYYITHIGVPVEFKPSRDRNVNSFAVTCPRCGSAPYVFCLKVDGTLRESPDVHTKRRGLAIQSGF